MSAFALQAERFKRWMFHEVLPSIRKTGQYAVKPLSPCEQLLVHAQLLVEQERRLERQQVEIEEIDCKGNLAIGTAQEALQRVESNHGMCSVMGWCARHKLPVDISKASKHGKALTRICNGLGIVVGSISDPRFGRVNTYPESVLHDYFKEQG